jgi:hypothetical protein
MLTPANDFDGLREKLESLGYTGLRETDESLIQALVAVHLTLEAFELSKAARGAVMDLLSSNGRDALESTPVFGEDAWMSFDYGNVKFGEFVRVKPDAYDSPTGIPHNGLVGILAYMSGGKCTVKYVGLASENSQPHPMEKLDSLKRGYNRRPAKSNKE